MIQIVLDACLDDIELHNASIADCLAKYPEYAEELKPLLQAAIAVRSAPDVHPSPEFKQALRNRILHLPDPPDQGTSAAEQEGDGTDSRQRDERDGNLRVEPDRTLPPQLTSDLRPVQD
ncbi:MAG: hypothetical protein M1570_04580 [Chloroflexi bacterium]|nr:hypothetical protein [Chloroflexota bacterium]